MSDIRYKIVKVDHIRCGEYSATTLVAAPAHWTVGGIEGAVKLAQQDYLRHYDAARKSVEESGPPDPGFVPRFQDFPDKTVREVMEEHQAKRDAYDEYKDKERQQWRRFEDFLADHGFVSLWDSDKYPKTEIEIDWGHRHGQRLGYGDQTTDSLPTPAELAGKEDDRWF